ncbi:mitotic spindle assembly hypothetical protein [Limosa lapponica baueri]|uniref:Uncharacterized protein n=1 Tax=Limosa lapponica baueri TaxID=1758121 RepID=A0A2I0THQ9_LIMLA|nr:mitotic spindle assembly hypothetical protein [Limosa lapponica baueri]
METANRCRKSSSIKSAFYHFRADLARRQQTSSPLDRFYPSALCETSEPKTDEDEQRNVQLSSSMNTAVVLLEVEMKVLKSQECTAEQSTAITKEEVDTLRLKIEELEAERSKLEEENRALEMKLEKLTLQVGDVEQLGSLPCPVGHRCPTR